MKLPLRLGIALTCVLAGFAQLQAAVEITRFSRQPDGIGITWKTEPGKTCTQLSTTSITGPWQGQTTLTATGASLSSTWD